MIEGIRRASGQAGAVWGVSARAQHLQLAMAQPGLAPTPVVALAEVTVERAAAGEPVRLRSALALHGVTTWCIVDLTSGQVTLRDARGGGWSGTVEAVPLPVRSLLARVVGEQSPLGGDAPAKPTFQYDHQQLGMLRIVTTRAIAAHGEMKELLVRVDDTGLLSRICATRAVLDWHAMALHWLTRGRGALESAVC